MRLGPLFVLIAALVTGRAGLGCVIGTEESPGCHTNADCGADLTCRAGACFGATTPRSPPDAADGGDAGDGGG
jgi:hypothetical protein